MAGETLKLMPHKRIQVNARHDGHACGEYIHFTTVDGHIVFAGRDSLQLERAVDLAAVNAREMLLGAEVSCASTRTSSGSDLHFLAQSHASQSHAEEAHTHRAIRYLRRDVPPRIQSRAIRHERRFQHFAWSACRCGKSQRLTSSGRSETFVICQRRLRVPVFRMSETGCPCRLIIAARSVR
jgi:hypothetical protein